jgi:hypothetical protein
VQAMATRHREFLSGKSYGSQRSKKFVAASRRNQHASRVRSPDQSNHS